METNETEKRCALCGEAIIAELDPTEEELCDDCEKAAEQNDRNLDEIEREVSPQRPLMLVCYDEELLWDMLYGPATN